MRRRSPEIGAVLAAFLVVGHGLAGCDGDGRELADAVPPLPAPTSTTIAPIATLASGVTIESSPTVGSSVVDDGSRVPSATLDELMSPEHGIALAAGSGATPSDAVTVDGLPADVVSFQADADGSFQVRVHIADEGAHTLCVADACGRVFTLDPNADTNEEVIAKIEAAIPLVSEIVPVEEWFPDWSIDIAGPMSGTGGAADTETRTVVVYRNRGRSVDDFVRTILHEYGHVADAIWLDDDQRTRFAALRGFEPTTAWVGNDGHEPADWSMSPRRTSPKPWWPPGRMIGGRSEPTVDR